MPRRDWGTAARNLTIANPRMTEIGGSHAQRDLFGQILLDAHLKLGNWAIAERMLEMRRTWDPDGVPLNRASLGSARTSPPHDTGPPQSHHRRRRPARRQCRRPQDQNRHHRAGRRQTLPRRRRRHGRLPGSRETELLAPDKLVDGVDASCSPAVQPTVSTRLRRQSDGLRAMGRGFVYANVTIPIVPAAILFDLANGGDKLGTRTPIAPSARGASAPARSSHSALPAAASAPLLPASRAASARPPSSSPSGHTVAALVGANPTGAATVGRQPAFLGRAVRDRRRIRRPGPYAAPVSPSPNPARTKREISERAISNTTIAIVATDADLTKAQLKRLAVAAQDGMARAVSPAHSLVDGDIVFCGLDRRKPRRRPDLRRHGHRPRRRRLPQPRHRPRRIPRDPSSERPLPHLEGQIRRLISVIFRNIQGTSHCHN